MNPAEKKKKLIVGITAPGSVGLLSGQLQYFNEIGYETYLLSPKDERSFNFCHREGCNLLEISIEREISILKDLKSLVSIIVILCRVKPDIVNFGTPKMGLLGLLAAFVCGIERRIYTCRGFRYEHERGLKRQILKRMEWLTGACAQNIICISPSVEKLAIKDKIFNKKKCIVINKGSSNGIDLTYFDRNNVQTEASDNLRRDLRLKDTFVFGFVGRIIDRKGISELFNAFIRIFEQQKNSRLLIVGQFDFNQISDKELAERMRKHPGVIMPGRTDDVPLFLSVMDVFVLPAWWEGFGNVLVQAAAMGIPVISTTGTGTQDAVKDGFNGILVEPKNALELELAMLFLLKNKDERTRLGNNGIEWAKHFDSRIIWRGMKELYNTVI